MIGVGNPYRGDDAVGIEFCRRLKFRAPAGVAVVASDGDPVSVIESWEGAEAVFVVDAVDSPDQTGRLVRFEAHDRPVPLKVFRFSTHALGVPETIELARGLGRLPRRVVVYGVGGGRFDHTVGLTPLVDEACDAAVQRVLDEIEEMRSHG